MKKTLLLLISFLLVLTALSGCGSKETVKEDSSETSIEGTDVVFIDPSDVRPNYGKLGFASNGFTFGIYDETAAVISNIGDPTGTFEAPSCAHQGSDYFYYYSGFELTCNIFNDVERVTCINVIDDTVSTPQGVTIGMAEADMLAAISTYTFEDQGSGKYVLTDHEAILQIIIKNEAVASITYLPKN